MNYFVLTKTSGVLGPIADLLGIIMDFLFRITEFFTVNLGGTEYHVGNIGLCIILFTLVVKLLMLPLTIKQQRSTKLMSVMQPEIQAVQKKYKGKNDQDSMMRMNVETKAVYEKYGTSMTGGCLQLIIQMPILFALYRVIYNIPAYVSSVRVYFDAVANSLTSQPDFVAKIQSFAETAKMTGDKYDFVANQSQLVDLLYKFTPAQWTELETVFPSAAQIINTNSQIIEKMNSFLGVNLASAPWQGFIPTAAWLIPILAGLSQWYTTKLMMSQQSNDESNPTAQSMKTMNMMMPLMSVFFCFTFPAAIGIYWVATSVVTIIQQVAINKYLDKQDIEQMIEKNMAKANEKRAKKGLPPANINQNAVTNLRNIEAKEKQEEEQREEKLEKTREIVKESTDYYNKDAKPGSLAAKAGMVAKYNEKHNK